MSDKKFPSPEEIQKEFEDFIHKRFGGSVQVVSPAAQRKQANPDQASAEAPPADEDRYAALRNFDLTPKDIKTHLDDFVIRQDDAKKALAIAVCDHYNRVRDYLEHGEKDDIEYAKQNVLLLGPTGVGKSYLIKHIAKLIGVPFVKADATRFTEMGYVGANADDLIRDLVNQAQGDTELAQFGIVYLDEADKLGGSPNSTGRDVSGRGVQFSFLKLMEETEVDLRSSNDAASQMQAFMEMQQKGRVERKVINTKHILFIVSGAFNGLEEIIQKRLNTNRIGFQTKEDQAPSLETLFEHLTTDDFVQFGFEPEFIGRLPVRVACHHLSVDDLYSILKQSKGSIIRQYQQSFKHYGIDARFEDESLREIAVLAQQQKTGARALMTVCERVFRDYKYELPNHGVDQLLVNAELIQNPQAQLKALLGSITDLPPLSLRRSVQKYEQGFKQRYGMEIHFDADAVAWIHKHLNKIEIPLEELCDQILHSYEHGLKLIQQNTGQQVFTITEDACLNPQATLECWIRESYLKQHSCGAE